MKLDQKTIVIIVLATALGLTLGLLFGKSKDVTVKTPAPVTPYSVGDSGKLAKEYKEKSVNRAIFENSKNIQECYLEYLKASPTITEGELVVLFKVEENGEMTELKTTKNEFNNQEFGECVNRKLSQIFLDPPPMGINRYISHTLSFIKEETAKALEEKRKKEKLLPKVLPVN